MSDLDSEFQRGLELRAGGRLEEALQVFDALARKSPGVARVIALRGLTLCHLERFEPGIADLGRAAALAPGDPAIHCDLGMVLFALDRLDEAEAALRRALRLAPAYAEALNNLGLVLRARGDFAGAEDAARRAIAAAPHLDAARLNLAYALLPQGRFAEAWPAHDHRSDARVNLRDPHNPGIVPHVERLPASDAPLVLHGEQGLGDTLFFLRFAPELRRRGHRLAFWGDPRLRPLLERAGLFEHFLAAGAVPAEGLAVAWVGDLPRMLGASEPAAFPPPLALAGDPERRASLRAHLARLGPPPFIGLTWRAGLERKGRIALSKAISVEALAAALAGLRGTFVSMQRQPAPGEIAAFSARLDAALHDGAVLNDRLEDALVAVEALDEYVAVSNTNVHLRAGAGRGTRVLVPWPPEWRWSGEGDASPWFPGSPVYRQLREGDWSPALRRLRCDLDG
jgi:tetratricopeptide (TPR) repeat protein